MSEATHSSSGDRPRSIDEVRALILDMSFARSMGLVIEEAGRGRGVVSMPLTDAVSYDGEAFAAMAVGVVGDVAAGAAALAMVPASAMVLTRGMDTDVSRSTRGDRLTGTATLRERLGDELVFDAEVVVHRGEHARSCGSVVVTLAVVREPT